MSSASSRMSALLGDPAARSSRRRRGGGEPRKASGEIGRLADVARHVIFS